MEQQVETLISYQTVELDSVAPSSTDDAVIQRTVNEVVSNIHNVPIELRGEAPLFFVLALFKQLRSVAVEITYRRAQDQPAIVIYSNLGQEYIRPEGVIDLAVIWSEEDMGQFEKQWEEDTQSETEIDLDMVWQKSRIENQVENDEKNTQEQLLNFLHHVYSMNPNKQQVSLTGSASLTAALLASNWFLSGGTKDIQFESHKLS